jgi:hypothetical protein
MNANKLIELYGRRLTPSVKLIAFITILTLGILILFKQKTIDQANNTNIEYQLKDS